MTTQTEDHNARGQTTRPQAAGSATVRSPHGTLHGDNATSAMRRRAAAAALPDRVTQLLRESGWLTLGALGIFVLMALSTFDRADPTWWRATGNPTHNWGGLVGANLAAGLHAMFGYCAWLGVGIIVYETHRSLSSAAAERNRVETGGEVALRGFYWRPNAASWVHLVGLLLLFLGAAGLEQTADIAVKHAHAGALWNVTGKGLTSVLGQWFGPFGSTLMLALSLMIGASLIFRLSWVAVAAAAAGQVGRFIDFVDDLRAPAADASPLDRASQTEAERLAVEGATQSAPSGSNAAPMASGERAEPFLLDVHEPIDTFAPPGYAIYERADSVAQPTPSDEEATADMIHFITDGASHGGESDESEPAEPPMEPSHLAEPSAPHMIEHPPLALLDVPTNAGATVTQDILDKNSRLIEMKLSDFGVEAKVVGAYPGPVVTRYEIDPATGVKGSQIVGLARDLARSLSLSSLRVVEVIPGKNYMGLELPNPHREIVRLAEIVGSSAYEQSTSTLAIALGKDIAGQPFVADLAKMPHLLVAGTTGSGKSVGINATILSLLYRADPQDVRLILIDPKMLEMSVYEGIPHLLTPVVTDMRLAANALNWCVAEMERRYKLMSKLGVRNIAGFNAKLAEAAAGGSAVPNPFSTDPSDPEPLHKLPSIVIVIDELADLMMVAGKKIEELIARIAQKARAAGIHLILATQRPSVDVITGLIKANIPTRIAFQVSSKIDSRTILDQMGAESLLGMGDMLYLPAGTGAPIRVHGAFVSDDEVHRVVEFLKAQGEPDYIDGIVDAPSETPVTPGGEGGEADELYDQAVSVVLANRKASTSLVQRHLRIGYNRAARLLEQMEQNKIVSPMSTNGNRDILVKAHPDEPGAP